MKFKRTVFLTAVVVAMGLLLGASKAQAATATIETRDGFPEIAIGINGLEIGANIYDVNWFFQSSLGAYGSPQTFPFNNEDKAREAAEAINAVFNEAGGITGVGELVTPDNADFRRIYDIGFDKFTGSLKPGGPKTEITKYWESVTEASGSDVWVSLFEGQADSRDTRSYAIFFDVGDVGNGNQAPTADAGGPYEGVVGVGVQFDGSANDPDGTIPFDGYLWDFADGTQSGVVDPLKIFDAPGVYNVIFTVTDAGGLSASDTTQADIREASLPPVADADGPYLGTVGVDVTFNGRGSDDPDGAVVDWSWEFGDGNTGSGVEATHSYSEAGIYDVTLTVTDNLGETAFDVTKAFIGTGNLPPSADAGGPYTGAAGTAVQFDGSGSSDPEGDTLSYSWDFGDDSEPGSGETPSHTYSAGGVYYVTLQVMDGAGVTASDATVAIIGSEDLPPVADAGGPYPGTAGRPVQFDGSNSTGTIATRDWNFGDGNFGEGETPTHTYAESGIYQVSLSVVDFSGERASDFTFAIIGVGNQAPQADAGGPYEGEVGVPVQFDGSESDDPDGIIVNRDWNFGDDSPVADGETPSHTYTEPGFYSVTHSVTDNTGANDADSTNVLIQSPSCECDLNTDGSCDDSDWLLFSPDLGRTDCNEAGVEPCECDLNDDGSCNFSDLLLFFSDWGRDDCPVPED